MLYYFAMRLARGKFLSCFYFCAGAQWLLQAFHHSFRNDILGGEGRILPEKNFPH